MGFYSFGTNASLEQASSMPELVLPMGANFVWRIFRIINISRLYLKCFNCFAALFYVSRIRYDHAAKNIFKSWRMQLRVSLLRLKSAYICCNWLKVPNYLCVFGSLQRRWLKSAAYLTGEATMLLRGRTKSLRRVTSKFSVSLAMPTSWNYGKKWCRIGIWI